MRHLNQLALVSSCLAALAMNGPSPAATAGPSQGAAAASSSGAGQAGSLDGSSGERLDPNSPIGTPYGDDVYNPTGPEADDSAPDSQWFAPSANGPGSLSPDSRAPDPHIGDPYFGNPFGDDVGDRGGDTLPPAGDSLSGFDRGDLTRDGKVDANDLARLVLAWGTPRDGSAADLNGDRFVDEQDVVELLALWR